MCIEEAIKHCEEVSNTCNNKECSLDHLQLRDWLLELKKYKESIDDEKLAELAREEWENKNYKYKVLPSSINDTKYGFILGFKASYHRTKKKNKI